MWISEARLHSMLDELSENVKVVSRSISTHRVPQSHDLRLTIHIIIVMILHRMSKASLSWNVAYVGTIVNDYFIKPFVGIWGGKDLIPTVKTNQQTPAGSTASHQAPLAGDHVVQCKPRQRREKPHPLKSSYHP